MASCPGIWGRDWCTWMARQKGSDWRTSIFIFYSSVATLYYSINVVCLFFIVSIYVPGWPGRKGQPGEQVTLYSIVAQLLYHSINVVCLSFIVSIGVPGWPGRKGQPLEQVTLYSIVAQLFYHSINNVCSSCF